MSLCKCILLRVPIRVEAYCAYNYSIMTVCFDMQEDSSRCGGCAKLHSAYATVTTSLLLTTAFKLLTSSAVLCLSRCHWKRNLLICVQVSLPVCRHVRC